MSDTPETPVLDDTPRRGRRKLAPLPEEVKGHVEKTAEQLAEYLLGSGTPSATIEQFEQWLESNPSANGEALYREMASAGVTLGTLRKAGKWVWGLAFEPEELNKQAPADEMIRLQAENANLREQLRLANSERAILQAKITYEVEKSTDLARQVAMLRVQARVNDPAGATA